MFKSIPLEKMAYRTPSGLVSYKPKLGRGNGNSHSYCNYFKRNGYSGYVRMGHYLFRYVVQQANERDITLAANILFMREPKDNIKEIRNYYMFFEDVGTAFIVKTFISEAPCHSIRIGTDPEGGGWIEEPFMDIWK